MAATQFHQVKMILPPISLGKGKPMLVNGHIVHGAPPRGLLRRPRAPLPEPSRPEPPAYSTGSPPPTKSVLSDFSHLNSYAGLYRYSPAHSLHTSVVSPPPPSELQSHYNYPPTHQQQQQHHQLHMQQLPQQEPRHAGYILKSDAKYILDPLFRDKTNVGTYVEGQGLQKDHQPSGPRPFHPVNLPKQVNALHTHPCPFDDDFNEARYRKAPAFTLQDFILKVSEVEKVSLKKVKRAIFSRHNYKKIQKILSDEMIPKQEEFCVMEMKPPRDLTYPATRVPQQQLLLEMAVVVKEQVSRNMNVEMKAIIRQLPKYSPSYKIGTYAPHTEILLYESQEAERQTSLGANEDAITQVELSILEALMTGGNALSLKAHFLTSLPDIQCLTTTVTYLNLSFNNLQMLPTEVLDLSQLVVLKLRNNPIPELPVDIGRLRNLRILILSFCLLTDLPPSIFDLSQLELLDVSYNRLKHVSNDIEKLRLLSSLNLAGNQLIGMPMGALRLRNLRKLKVSNNFMHPLFWDESSRSKPQRLTDICALNLSNYDVLRHYREVIPDYIETILDNCSSCECCNGPLYGPGLRVIRPRAEIFGVHNLPFLFTACSLSCKRGFSVRTVSLVNLLYGAEDSEGDDSDYYDEEDISNM